MRTSFVLLILLFAIFAVPAQAALEIQITEGATGAVPIAVAPFKTGQSVPRSFDLTSIINADLRGTGMFKPLSPEDMLAKPSRPEEVTFRNWRAVKVDYLVVGSIKAKDKNRYSIQFSILDVHQQSVLAGFRVVAGKRQVRDVAHTIANRIYQTLTDDSGYFRSRIAYVTSSQQNGQMHYELVVSDYDGHDAQVILSSSNPIMSPDWNAAGTKLAYVVINKQKGRSSIRIRNLITGEVRVISARPGINGAPAWSPTGNKLAVTLSYEGNTDIYIYNLVTDEWRQLTHSPAIDTGVAWSPDGGYVVFTSGRGGAPQIYKMPVHGGQAERLTYRGESNQNAEIGRAHV